ncbi:MAG: NAD(P)-binding domain-containing protein [Rhodobacteraceae bacterium]|nr:NAD(P)-binding domain-containing protein [Paracoccaceae bacterium]
MSVRTRVGIIGGAGQLGSAIARAVLSAGAVTPENLWISSRSGGAGALSDWPGLTVTTDNRHLAENCGTVILSVPPASAGQLGIAGGDRLVISVMAGVTLARLQQITGSDRVVRAMSSPAAALGMAYSPFIATPAVSAADRQTVRAILSACGMTDEVQTEGHIDHFTALTGPVPGFVALFADCMIRHAEEQGIAPALADRAIRQLFRASATVLGQDGATPAEQVQAMVDYAGTTAAGIAAMREAGLGRAISAGLAAAAERAMRIAVDQTPGDAGNLRRGRDSAE